MIGRLQEAWYSRRIDDLTKRARKTANRDERAKLYRERANLEYNLLTLKGRR